VSRSELGAINELLGRWSWWSLSAFARRINRDLEQLSKKFPNIYLLDYANLNGSIRQPALVAPGLYYTARMEKAPKYFKMWQPNSSRSDWLAVAPNQSICRPTLKPANP